MRYRSRREIEAVQWFANGHCPVWAQDVVTEHGDHFVLSQPNWHDEPIHGQPGWWIFRYIDRPGYVDLQSDDAMFKKWWEPVSDK